MSSQGIYPQHTRGHADQQEEHHGQELQLKASSIDEPRLVFTPAVTEADLAKLHHRPTEFGTGVFKTIMYIEEESQNKLMRRAEAYVGA